MKLDIDIVLELGDKSFNLTVKNTQLFDVDDFDIETLENEATKLFKDITRAGKNVERLEILYKKEPSKEILDDLNVAEAKLEKLNKESLDKKKKITEVSTNITKKQYDDIIVKDDGLWEFLQTSKMNIDYVLNEIIALSNKAFEKK